MESIHSLKKLSLREIKAILQGLNHIQITGADAMFIGMLQIKIQNQIKEIEAPPKPVEPKTESKEPTLKIIETTDTPTSPKKSTVKKPKKKVRKGNIVTYKK